ncbi:MAG TPA: alpha-amylase family glycosyl hydrolase [Methylomirabilota bacterium]|nr:alpha-amylase family glycosyl hydrolase [Methylomirabilota bacterium]
MNTNFHWKDAIIYQIYPRSFQDSNGDGIGDLNGITKRINYLKSNSLSSLGVDAIWLSPFYPSPMKDGGYDISNYCNVDPQFGTLDDFDRLLTEAHNHELRVIIDFIPNHTSNEHEWFKESRSSKNNPKRDWYIWRDGKIDGSPPNNWISVFGGPAWLFDKKTEQYYLHSFAKEQPDLNWENPQVKKTMYDVIRFWLRRGVDGIRVDAFNQVLKDYSFADDPVNPLYKEGKDDPYNRLLHTHSKDVAGKLYTLKEICNVMDEFEQKLLITEAYLEIEDLLHYYKVGQKETLSPFNFFMLRKPWKASIYKDFLKTYEKDRQVHDIGNFVLSNHDNPRIASRIGRNAARVASVLLFTLRGIPFIYYGDELGMKDGEIPSEYAQDPKEINNPGKGLSRDPARTPMQWDRKPNAGFSTGKPWLPVVSDFMIYNVKNEQNDQDSFLSLYKTLIAIRKASPALRRGSYLAIEGTEDNILTFLREEAGEKIVVVLNFSSEEKQISLPFGKSEILYHLEKKDKSRIVSLKTVDIGGNDAYILRLF